MNKIINRLLTCSLLIASAAFAESKPIAGEVIAGSLKGKTLTFTSYGGIFQDGQIAALKDFVDKSGVRLLSDGPTELAKLQAQINSGHVTWDVVDTGDLAPYVHCGKLFQRLDLSKLDTSNIPAGQVGPCSVPAMNYAIMFLYKNESYKENPPKNWKDFFDSKKFPGVRAIENTGEPVGSLIEQAILAAGGAAQNLTAADITLGINKIRELGSDTIFWKTGAESQQLAESGEADMIMMWSGRAMTAIKNGADYTPVWQDWLVVMDQMTIPVGVKDIDASYALLNYYLGEQAQQIMAEQTSYSPIHKQAKPKVNDITAAFMTNSPERMAQAYQWNIQFWADNYPQAMQQWTELVSGY